jgi:hypothetical protein
MSGGHAGVNDGTPRCIEYSPDYAVIPVLSYMLVPPSPRQNRPALAGAAGEGRLREPGLRPLVRGYPAGGLCASACEELSVMPTRSVTSVKSNGCSLSRKM